MGWMLSFSGLDAGQQQTQLLQIGSYNVHEHMRPQQQPFAIVLQSAELVVMNLRLRAGTHASELTVFCIL